MERLLLNNLRLRHRSAHELPVHSSHGRSNGPQSHQRIPSNLRPLQRGNDGNRQCLYECSDSFLRCKIVHNDFYLIYFASLISWVRSPQVHSVFTIGWLFAFYTFFVLFEKVRFLSTTDSTLNMALCGNSMHGINWACLSWQNFGYK